VAHLFLDVKEERRHLCRVVLDSQKQKTPYQAGDRQGLAPAPGEGGAKLSG